MIVTDVIDALIARESGYVDHPSDRGGPTRWGVTEMEARAHGYTGDMRQYPKESAREVYLHKYWTAPQFHLVSLRSWALADELFDTGVNMGPKAAGKMLQRVLNVLNRRAVAYPDVEVDGDIGKMTLYALDRFISARGPEGLAVLLKALNSLQGARYVEISEANPSQEDFVYGWLRERVS